MPWGIDYGDAVEDEFQTRLAPVGRLVGGAKFGTGYHDGEFGRDQEGARPLDEEVETGQANDCPVFRVRGEAADQRPAVEAPDEAPGHVRTTSRQGMPGDLQRFA